MLKKIILTVLCLILLPFLGLNLSAEESEDGTKILTATFYVITTDQDTSMKVPFNPAWFRGSAAEYNHDIAKFAMGLTVAAFRPDEEHSDPEKASDSNAVSFLTQAGFKDLQSDDYEKNPSIYTISTIMGHEKVGEGDDAFELIAVGVCGQGYMDEWESNFSIGDGDIHKGFSGSAKLVYNRIFGYISAHHLHGPIKILITGFSRAAAVSNVTAAMLSESDTFNEDTVFAYTFATPRTTREKNRKEYSNIFNIVGKIDPVAYIPFAEWGYDRYGKNLYIPELETDSDYLEKRREANVVYKEVTGIDFWSNIEMHNELMIVLDYLIHICPSPEIYTEGMQDKLIKLWNDPSPVNVMSNLLDISNDPILINEENRHEANAFLDYLTTLGADYATHRNSFRRWNKSASVGSNMVQAHTPELYVSWIFSVDKGEDLYSDPDTYLYMFLPTDCEVEYVRGKQVIETYVPGSEYNAGVYLNVIGEKLVALLQTDTENTLNIKFGSSGTIPILTASYEVGWQAPETTDILYFEAEAGEELSIHNNRNEHTYSSEGTYSEKGTFSPDEYLTVSDMLLLEKRNFLNLSWRTIVLLIGAMIAMAATAMVFQITWLTGRIRFSLRKRRGWIPKEEKFHSFPMICGAAVFHYFLMGEFAALLSPEVSFDRQASKLIIGTLCFIIAVIGYRKRPTRLNNHLLLAIIMLTVTDVIMIDQLIVGTFMLIVTCLFLSMTFWKEEKPMKTQLIAWASMSLFSAVIILVANEFYGTAVILPILYTVSAILMVVTSVTMSRQCLTASILLFVGGLFMIITRSYGTSPAAHLLTQGTYYAAMVFFAGNGITYPLPRLIPETALLADGDPEISSDIVLAADEDPGNVSEAE